MSMDQFLDSLTMEALQELKQTAQKQIAEQGESQLDGEAEMDRLLMMHMSKRHHEDEMQE